jgi:hypothetical protein
MPNSSIHANFTSTRCSVIVQPLQYSAERTAAAKADTHIAGHLLSLESTLNEVKSPTFRSAQDSRQFSEKRDRISVHCKY